MGGESRDCWAEWLAERRFGGDAEVRERFLAELRETCDRVLDGARLESGETVLDVGCGDGLIAFGALERGAGEVVFSDISADLLGQCRVIAEKLGVHERCRFVRASADDLTAVEHGSVDVVTTRSVLIYVKRKRAAFAEFIRVLRKGGRISLFEPINRFGLEHMRRNDRYWGFDATPVAAEAAKLRAVYEAIQPPDSDPMLDFDERDLVQLAEEAGFHPIELELQAEIKPSDPISFKAFLNQSGNPRIPTLAEAMEQVLTPEERERFKAHLRPLVEEGRGEWRMATALLKGAKRQ
jgi:ubiquinone/menaquinone biosynthesis C-methylase UbiE